MIHKEQLRNLIRETLEHMGTKYATPSAVELLMMTCAHESRLGSYLKQVNGPALGLFQMEPDTLDDLWDNYINYHKDIEWHFDLYQAWDTPDELTWNHKFAIVAARLQYYRVTEALPGQPEELARYAKQYWNTDLGKAEASDYLEAYEDLCL